LALLKIESETQLLRTPMLGSVWEGFALEETLQALEIRSGEAFYCRTSNGVELDLLLQYQAKRLGFEFKFADALKISKSMNSAFEDLKLNHLYIVYPGERTYEIDSKITVLSINDLKTIVAIL
jgi:predicted AAA+ superfamily ATPase